jgi:hypothetical protein
VGKSRQVIETLLKDMEKYISEYEVVYEAYKELPEDLEPRQDIQKIRIALYNDSETEVTKVGAEKPADSRQQYGIDISVVRGYRGEGAYNHELVALDVKDDIIEWIKNLDAFESSNGSISSFGYDSATGFLRRKRFVTMTLNCSGQKDLIVTQP